jgi:hypothetical protein
MWWILACSGLSGPDPDPGELLRQGRADEAVAAYQAAGGTPFAVGHPLAQVLFQRARTDPSVTLGAIADGVEAASLLDARPRLGLRDLDRPFVSMRALLAGAQTALGTSSYVAVGRSLSRGDKDAHLNGAALPWQGGRIVGWARGEVEGSFGELGARIDADPPARLITVGLRTATHDFWIFVEKNPDGWIAKTSSDPQAAGPVLLASDREAP